MPARVTQAALIAAAFVVVAAGWIVVVTLLAPPALPPAHVVSIPPIGQVAAVRLADGRPVFVMHHQTGAISVLDGFSTHVPYGVSKMLAWCPEARIFEDLASGARYDEWGTHIAGPAPTSMIAFSWQMGAGGQLSVGLPLGPVGPPDATNPPPVNLADCTRTMHDFDEDPRFTPRQAVAQPEGSWVVAAGIVDPQLQRLCGLGAGCPAPAAIDGLDLHTQLTQADVDYLTDPRLQRWLARVTDGRLTHLTMIWDLDST